MLDKVKKYGIIVIIAILFALFSFSIVDVVMEEPEYEDFCDFKEQPLRLIQGDAECPSFPEPTDTQRDDCNAIRGTIEYSYDASGCPMSFECSTCRTLYDDARKQYRLVGFIITSTMGVMAVIVGMYVKSRKEVIEWIFSGFLIGGIISIFIGTVSYFHDMGRFVKPFVLLGEMIIIIWIAIRTSIKNKKTP